MKEFQHTRNASYDLKAAVTHSSKLSQKLRKKGAEGRQRSLMKPVFQVNYLVKEFACVTVIDALTRGKKAKIQYKDFVR